MFSKFPTSAEISESFTAHYGYYKGVRGIVAESAAKGEAAVSRQYAGRVAFELLQNALDRAATKALVRRDGAHLVVANDGRGVSCHPSFNLNLPITADNKPSDFHSLCSMHTSNKDPEVDNGNKGVGFRSVFSVASRVYVWSRLQSGEWWGLLLLRDISPQAWSDAAKEPDVVAGLEAFLPNERSGAPIAIGERRPSFHFPLPLRSDVPPIADVVWAHTVIVLPCDEPDAAKSLDQSIANLSASHLEFLGLRHKPSITVHLDGGRTLETSLSETVARWDVIADETQPVSVKLFAQAKLAGLDLKHHIGGAVRWPAYDVVTESTGKIYCYLATEVPCPFGIDIHADLQTGIDRKHLEVKETEAVGAYNRALLIRSLDLHIQQIEAHIQDRMDIWKMLDPGPGLGSLKANDEPVRHLLAMHMRERLFGGNPITDPKSWRKWASLAARCFNSSKRTGRTFDQFWAATEHWINAAFPSGSSKAKDVAKACLAALRDAEARVIPITEQDAAAVTEEFLESVTPPLPGEAGTRSSERLFHVTQEQREQFNALAMPPAISARGRRLTTWEFPEPFKKGLLLIGSVGFERAALLQELRQLTAANVLTASSDSLDLINSHERQIELIVFAAKVFMLRISAGKGTRAYSDDLCDPGWRADDDDKGSDDFAAGRAVATLFLPTTAGYWEPARQIKRSQVALDLVTQLRLHVPEHKVDAFLCFLGVATWSGELPLVEAGNEGLVEPQQYPPQLCDAGTGHAIQALSVPLNGIDQSTLAARLDEAWKDGWLVKLEARETQRPRRINVCKALGAHPWYPVGEPKAHARSPVGMESVPTVIAPRRLTITGQYQRVQEAVWRVDAEGCTASWLRAIGARGLSERLDNPSMSAEIIFDIADAYPDVAAAVRNRPTLRFVLVELFNRALTTVIDRKDTIPWPQKLPLLAEALEQSTSRRATLRWTHPTEVYVASDNKDREVLQRHAPDLTLLVTPVGTKQVLRTPVETRIIKLRSTVIADDELVDAEVSALQALFLSLLPRLLALAEFSRRYNHGIDASLVAEKWRCTELRRTSDVWRKWTLTAVDLHSREESDRKGKFNDVMYVDLRNQADVTVASRIFYDVSPEQNSRGVYRPPLTEFAEALAAILLDRTIEPTWRAALGEYEARNERGLDEYLERIGVSKELVEFMQAGVAPLDPTLLAQHRQCVEQVLSSFGLCLAASWNANSSRTILLGTHAFEAPGGPSMASEEDVNMALGQAGYIGESSKFIPTFESAHTNLAKWKRFASGDHRELRLLRFQFDRTARNQVRPRDMDLLTGELADSLKVHINKSAKNLRFYPEQVARVWIGTDFANQPIDDWLPKFSTFAPVKSPPAFANLRKMSASNLAPSISTAMPPTLEEQNAENAAKVAKGDGAEISMLAWVVPETRKILDTDFDGKAWRALLSAFPTSGAARKCIETAGKGATEDQLKEALWVSRIWRGSGFDIVGLRLDGEIAAPARYEVKALPRESNVRLFISANELAVYRATRTPGTASRENLRIGTWDLVGVREDGKALILTEALKPILDPETGGLSALAVEGFSAESLQLVIGIDTAV